MNKKRLLPRLIVSPIILAFLIVAFLYKAINLWCRFMWYGGEWITLDKDDKVTMSDIYNELKKQHNV